MKYINSYKAFFEYNSDVEDRSNYILDKINSVGIDNITPEERSFLDSMKDEKSAIKSLDDYNRKFYDETFKSDSGRITFSIKSITKEDSMSDDGIITYYHGTMILSNDIISESYNGTYNINEMGIYMADFYDGDNNIEDSELFIDNNEYDSFLLEISIDLSNVKIK